MVAISKNVDIYQEIYAIGKVKKPKIDTSMRATTKSVPGAEKKSIHDIAK